MGAESCFSPVKLASWAATALFNLTHCMQQ